MRANVPEKHVGFGVPMSVVMKISTFWDIMSCSQFWYLSDVSEERVTSTTGV
jgi:hypothetical protein